MTDHPNVRRFLDLSTAHLSPTALAWLAETSALNFAAAHHGFGGGAAVGCVGATLYGFFMHAPVLQDDGGIDNGIPADMLPVIRFAHTQDCHYILFDADGELIDGLEVYSDD